MRSHARIERDVWALSVATFINRATGFLGLFAAVFFTEIRMDAGTLVTALLAVGVAGVVGALVGGQLASRFGEQPVLILSTTANVALFTSLALADYSATGAIITLSAASVVASQAFVGPAAARIASSVGDGQRVTRFAFYRIFVNVGSIVTPTVVGIIGREHFHALFWISAGGSAVVPFVLLSWRRNPAAVASDVRARADNARGITQPRPYVPRHALPFVYAAMVLVMVVYAQHQSAVPLRMQTEPRGVQLYSLLLVINPLIVLIVEYPLSRLTKRLSGASALAVGVVVMGVGVATTGSFANRPGTAIFGWLLFSIGECVFAPVSNSYVAELSTSATHARSQGRLAAFQAIGSGLGPGVGSWMLITLPGLTWLGFLLFALVAAALVYSAGRGIRPGSARRVHVSITH